MTVLFSIAEFLLNLFTGKLWKIWQAHKLSEAENAVAKVDSLNANELHKQFESDLVRKQ